MWWRRQSWVAGKSRDSSWPHRCCPNSTCSWWREVIKYFAELLGPFQSSACRQKWTLLCWPKMGFVPRLLWCCKLPSQFAGEVGEGEKTALGAPLLGSHLASPGLLVYLLGVRTSILLNHLSPFLQHHLFPAGRSPVWLSKYSKVVFGIWHNNTKVHL